MLVSADAGTDSSATGSTGSVQVVVILVLVLVLAVVILVVLVVLALVVLVEILVRRASLRPWLPKNLLAAVFFFSRCFKLFFLVFILFVCPNCLSP